jgi:hypothetical protein
MRKARDEFTCLCLGNSTANIIKCFERMFQLYDGYFSEI